MRHLLPLYDAVEAPPLSPPPFSYASACFNPLALISAELSPLPSSGYSALPPFSRQEASLTIAHEVQKRSNGFKRTSFRLGTRTGISN